jgi:hypothetical protein
MVVNVSVRLISAIMLLVAVSVVWADDEPSLRHHETGDDASKRTDLQGRDCRSPTDPSDAFESVQIETSDIRLYEQFFESVLQSPVVQRVDHPRLDSLRGYCYRGVLIVVRQDFRTPRPTGWVQINFLVQNVAALQGDLERAYRASSVYQLREEDRAKIVRFRLKPDVMRGDRQVIRLEVAGPEGFMIGFDQDK